jgi:hypothetical protein
VKNGDAVLLDLEGRRCEEPPSSEIIEDDGSKKDVFQKAKSWLVIVGEKDIVAGLDIGLVSRKITLLVSCAVDSF